MTYLQKLPVPIIEGEFELVYNDRESITNDSEKGILIVISIAHQSLYIGKIRTATVDMPYLTHMIR